MVSKMRGDFVLYRPLKFNLFEWLISTITKGNFIHSEIDLGQGMFIGEHGKGITRHAADLDRIADGSAILVSPFGKTPTEEHHKNIEEGLAWVDSVWREAVANHETHEYGWMDLISGSLEAFGLHFVLRIKVNDWDCSDFVTRYLNVAHAAGPLGGRAADPETVSPNDLARAFKVK
jgi:hypothetical protein